MGVFRKFAKWLGEGEVPDCPSCHGSGEPGLSYDIAVYWKGRIHHVCYQCRGSGKV